MGFAYKKKEGYLLLHEVTIIVHYPPKTIVGKTHLNTTKVKLPVASSDNQPYLKCKYMVEKYAYSRGVVHCLTNNASKVG